MTQNPAIVGLVRQQLEALGWTDEDPVPTNLPQLFQTIKTSAITQLQQDLKSAADDPVQKAEIVGYLQKLENDAFFRVENFPPQFVLAAQQQLFVAIQDAKDQIAAAQKLEEVESQLPPQIQGEERAKIIDRYVNAQKESEETQQENPATSEPEPDSHAKGLEYCPCCSWKLADKYEVTVTDEDKQNYVAAVMGNMRFRKTYPLFNGKGSVTFRTLLTTESDAIRFYLFEQSKLGKITSDVLYLAAWVSTNTLLSLESVYYNDKPTVYASTYETYAKSHGDIHEAAGLEEYVQNMRDLVSQDTLRTLVFAQYDNFSKLVEHLKSRANDPDFYSGI
jgi:hypothetical protein